MKATLRYRIKFNHSVIDKYNKYRFFHDSNQGTLRNVESKTAL